jgi:hypothetical protein
MTFTRLWLPAFFVLLGAVGAGSATKYSGPWPPKPDVPYLVHADNLIETEAAMAQNEDRGNSRTSWVQGASSPVSTPLAEPIFLIEAQKIVPEKLELYKFEVRRGRREVNTQIKGNKGVKPLRLTITKLEDRLYRIEANQGLENGEYSLSPDGSDQAFCFQVY